MRKYGIPVLALLVFTGSAFIGRNFFFGEPPMAENSPRIIPIPVRYQVSNAENVNVTKSHLPEARRRMNTSLVEKEDGWENNNHKMAHHFPVNYATGVVHAQSAGFGEKVRWVPGNQELRRKFDTHAVLSEPAAVNGKVENNGYGEQRVVYRETHPNVDEKFYARQDGGAEHDVILKQIPSGLSEAEWLAFTGRLELRSDLTLWVEDEQLTGRTETNGPIAIKSRHGHDVFILRSPYAFDANVTRKDGTLNKELQAQEEMQKHLSPCRYQVDIGEDGISLAVVVPTKWLASAERAYPVVVDPNIGPGGLSDRYYVGEVGTGDIRPLHNAGGSMLSMTICPFDMDQGVGLIPLPFDFVFYGIPLLAGIDILTVHIDGFASFLRFEPIGPPNLPCEILPANNADPHRSAATYGPAFFPYWDDLKFGKDGAVTAMNPVPAKSWIYYTVEGTAPNRMLIVEWFNMGFTAPGDSDNNVTFNLILYECDSMFQYLLLDREQTDPGHCTVGVEAPAAGVDGIRYAFNSIQDTGQRIMPATSITFTGNALGQLRVKTIPDDEEPSGCVPFKVCFDSQLTPPSSDCGGDATPPTYTYRWQFIYYGINGPYVESEAFVPDICYNFTSPGEWIARLTVTDNRGAIVVNETKVHVCDVPRVRISADPQGGYWPLLVYLDADVSQVGSISYTGEASWYIERLGNQNEPGIFTPVGTMGGNNTSFRFDFAGLYRVTATFTGIDTITNLPTSASGVVFIFVEDPGLEVGNGMLITASGVTVDWCGKMDNITPLNPNAGPDGFPDKPKKDALYIRGFLNMPGVSQSQLTGQKVRVILNGVQPLFEGYLDAEGKAEIGNAIDKRLGLVQIRQPSGSFNVSLFKQDLPGPLGVNNVTERRLLPAQFRIELGSFWPPENSGGGGIITYDYESQAYLKAKGTYKFGCFTKDGVFTRPSLRIGQSGYVLGKIGGQNLLVSGVFMPLDAKANVKGNDVYLDIRGMLARFGGDDLRPAVGSDVVVTLGGFSEALNFGGTPSFRTTGKEPSQKFSFKRSKTLPVSGVQSLQWANRAGQFRIKTGPIPNEKLGLDLNAATQNLTFKLNITPDGSQKFEGSTTIELSKKSATKFSKKGK
jgi:hypothetical protein